MRYLLAAALIPCSVALGAFALVWWAMGPRRRN
jgi:hypothetical protein